jgi:hypothetical protein
MTEDNMRNQGTALFALAGILLGGLVATTGCGDAEIDDTVAEDVALPGTPAFHSRRHFRGRTGMAGNTGAGGGGSSVGGDAGAPVTSCEVCTKAQQCCDAANVTCTFSASTCSTLSPAARDPYAHNCLVFLKAIVGAHIGRGVSPPAACQ